MVALKDEIYWLGQDPAYGHESFASEDYLCFIRAIRMELLDYVHDLAERPATKHEFLLELSKLKEEWKTIAL